MLKYERQLKLVNKSWQNIPAILGLRFFGENPVLMKNEIDNTSGNIWQINLNIILNEIIIPYNNYTYCVCFQKLFKENNECTTEYSVKF